MKIIIAPDKFKGSLTSLEACTAIEEGIRLRTGQNIEVIKFPMADGGDGFNSVLQHYFHTTRIEVETVDPLQRPIQASYQWNAREKIAIIEMATASGLVLVKEKERNPLLTSTYGTGILIKHAVAQGASRVILGLGGSATNDAGIGILAALGFRFINKAGEELTAVGGDLLKIDTIIPPATLPSVYFEIAADVENPLFGPMGAAYVYGPQKGADPEMVKQLDLGLQNMAAIIASKFGKQVATFPGSGAAGGIAAGLSAFFEVEMKKGVDLVLNANGLEKELNTATLIITGEGKIDNQSGSGKVVGTMAALAQKYAIPCIAFCGLLDASLTEVKDLGLKAAYPFKTGGLSLDESMAQGYALLVSTVDGVMGEWLSG
jgi:glycerate kinase